MAGRGVAPALVAAGAGVLVSGRLPGAPGPLAAAAPDDLTALGRLVRRVHDTRAGAAGGLPEWRSRVRSLAGYRRRRVADAVALAGRAGVRGRLPRPPAPPRAARDAERPFRLLHGDLVEANVVWGPGGPRLVDWEFWRMGDPAEDLAYLAELNGLPAPALAAVAGAYDDPDVAARIEGWRTIVALEAGAWYTLHGALQDARRMLARVADLAG